MMEVIQVIAVLVVVHAAGVVMRPLYAKWLNKLLGL
jgi:hypothetical protein